MKKVISTAALILALAGGMAVPLQPATACGGTVHLPNCGPSGSNC